MWVGAGALTLAIPLLSMRTTIFAPLFLAISLAACKCPKPGGACPQPCSKPAITYAPACYAGAQACSSDADCASLPGNYCEPCAQGSCGAGQCKLTLIQGQACDSPSACAAGLICKGLTNESTGVCVPSGAVPDGGLPRGG